MSGLLLYRVGAVSANGHPARTVLGAVQHFKERVIVRHDSERVTSHAEQDPQGVSKVRIMIVG
jgi:hypothetical protein